MKAVRNYPMSVLAPILMLGLCVGQDANSQAPRAHESARSQGDRDKVIYVSDFDLDAANFKQDKGGITGKGYLLPAPPKSPLRRKRQDPATAASNLVRLMSESLVADLQKAGFKAQRLGSTESKPTEGLLVSGVFTELSEGNQMRRALLGFGSGKSKMELYIMVADASSAANPLYGNVGAKEQWERARNRNRTEPICRSGRIGCEVRNDKECSREDGQANCVEDRNATREAAKCRFPDGG